MTVKYIHILVPKGNFLPLSTFPYAIDILYKSIGFITF